MIQPLELYHEQLQRQPRFGPCLDYTLARNNRSKYFGVEYWTLPGSNTPWRPWLYFKEVLRAGRLVFCCCSNGGETCSASWIWFIKRFWNWEIFCLSEIFCPSKQTFYSLWILIPISGWDNSKVGQWTAWSPILDLINWSWAYLIKSSLILGAIILDTFVTIMCRNDELSWVGCLRTD